MDTPIPAVPTPAESTPAVPTPDERRDALAETVLGNAIATMELFSMHIGDRLGYYHALADHGAATSTELADRTGTHERYAREWLEQQAMAGVLEVDDTGDALTRRFTLPPGHDEALTDLDSLACVAPMAQLIAGLITPMPALLEAFRTGGGVPYPDYGTDTREGIAAINRVLFLNLLAQEWLLAMPDIVARLEAADPPARVADIGCGTGWSSIAIAQGFPSVRVDGFDLDAASIVTATANAAAQGVADRVSFQTRDAGDPDLAGTYDLACAFECIHDMSDPVSALSTMRRLVGEGGTVFIADERVADVFTANGDETERMMYGFSVLHCLPVGMADQPSVGTGTVIRADTMRRYAAEAGFAEVEILDIDNLFWRFYRLTA